MEVQDGFIVGIFNYCDRWCDACPLTSRCRVFADMAQMEAALDPSLKDVADAPAVEEDPPLPEWLKDLLERQASDADGGPAIRYQAPELPPEHQAIATRARDYGRKAHDWLDARGFLGATDSADPRAVISWYLYFIPAKIHRALHGLASDEPEERDWPADYDGSAKVALLAIERSHAAWLNLAQHDASAEPDMQPFIAELISLGDALDRVFPNARAFVRPAFDEPDEVAKLLAQDGGGA